MKNMFEAAFNESLTKEELKGNQKKLDVAPPYGKLTGADFKKLRGNKKKIDKEGNEFTGKLAAAKASGKDSFEIGGKTVDVKENFGLDIEARRKPAPAPAPVPVSEPSDSDVWAKSLDKGTEPGDFDAAQNPALKLDTEGVQKAREWIKKLEDMATFINGMDENSLNSQINALEMRNSIPFKGIVRRKEKQITDIAEKLRALAELFKTVVTGSQKKIHDATAR
jgi:hypothetical protein